MSGRLTYMKYTAIVAVAVLSFILAIPLSHQPAKQQIDLSFKPVKAKVAATPVAKPTATHIASALTPVQPTVPTPVATPAPKIVTSSANLCASYAPLFAQYGWNTDVAMAICSAESKGSPTAVSPTDDYGLMQINHGLEIYGSAIYDPAFNIKIAYTVKYLGRGWLPWTTYTSGIYAQYL
jgi:soluble lytic murein transglycosylase-like protein